MQNAGFAAAGLDWSYVALPTPPDRLTDSVRGLAALGFRGANITIPHKQAVVDLCDDVDEFALRVGSVNTLVIDDGRISGSSTDGLAVTTQIEAAEERCLVLGRGGAALAVAGALEDAGAADVVFATRHDASWPPDGSGFGVLVNATPIKNDVVVVPSAHQQVVDLAYLPDGRETALVRAARAVGCRAVVDGMDVLLAQGAASFERWTGIVAPRDAMRAALDAATA
jgi:shikimate dehydrogenase